MEVEENCQEQESVEIPQYQCHKKVGAATGCEASELNASLCVDTIDHVDDNSSGSGESYMTRARIYFKNGHELSVIRGNFSYGGDKGLFEIMPSDEKLLDGDGEGDSVAGYLSAERVKYYIDKIGNLPNT